ncbi:MAG: CoA pyrophosphatase [Pseudomonadota bacterium]
MDNVSRSQAAKVDSLSALSGAQLLDRLFESLLLKPLIPVTHPPAIFSSGERPTNTVPDPSGDHVLNPDFSGRLVQQPLKPAAVLIAINRNAAEPEVVMTVRTANLSSHAGQIAFPGGRIDPGEAPEEAAVREAFEEVGLDQDAGSLKGFLPSYASRTGYRVYPVVSLVDGWPPLVANPAEVADIFFVPLRFLLDPRNVSKTSRFFEGAERFFYTYQYGDRRIWGLTAGIIHHMSSRVLTN